MTYPVIDLFAGPGGLGEGFTALSDRKGRRVFSALVSIEKDLHAYETLRLRHFFRSFKKGNVPEEYYDYLAEKITKDELIEQYFENWKEAGESARLIELGSKSHRKVRELIEHRLSGRKKWALVGGPPCQAYSLVGRSRMKGKPSFEEDDRHFLYQEYLKIIIDHRPPVFVMENVKGLLSATVNGQQTFQKIITDLRRPRSALENTENGLKYRLYSLSRMGEIKDLSDPSSFLVRAENYGVPQARHRIFILGIRSDISVEPGILKPKPSPTVREVIGSLPRLRSGISKAEDNAESWRELIKKSAGTRWFKTVTRQNEALGSTLTRCLSSVERTPGRRHSSNYSIPTVMKAWFHDRRLKGITDHEARSHMEKDIHRYLFSSAFAQAMKVSPKLSDFPADLLPHHRNVMNGSRSQMFADRFRVQLADNVSSTITSHISKDGHYFIHYDPAQCRSLTVREAARLQTFPDNYHFEGPRTAKYHQVGNAVPPFLAKQIAEIVKDILDRMQEGTHG
ncbi:DNA cytosine methyltransferase [Nitrospina sp. 32_T5]|uniref:DNA cytosine methyltransferase n=1 Tax=unclassified Nitrospina TaxID=2638683 RepID=UPI003F9BCAE6